MVNRLDVHTHIYFELASSPIVPVYELTAILNLTSLTTSSGRPTQYGTAWPEVKHGRFKLHKLGWVLLKRLYFVSSFCNRL